MRLSKLKSGQKYGNLTLIDKLEDKNKYGAYFWRCVCICGKEKIVDSGKVRKGNSCGCIALKNHIERGLKPGKRFGRLEIIKRLDQVDKYRSRYYLCKCDCGNTKSISSHNLIIGGVEGCGCLFRKKLEFGAAAFNQLYSCYKISAKKRSIEFEITKEEFKNLTKSQCYYCDKLPEQIICRKRGNGEYIYNGIDRIHSDLGYNKINCVACCGICNKMKLDIDKDEFLNHVYLIYRKHEGMIFKSNEKGG